MRRAGGRYQDAVFVQPGESGFHELGVSADGVGALGLFPGHGRRIQHDQIEPERGRFAKPVEHVGLDGFVAAACDAGLLGIQGKISSGSGQGVLTYVNTIYGTRAARRGVNRKPTCITE